VPLVTVGVLAPGVPQTITDDVLGGRLATGHLLRSPTGGSASSATRRTACQPLTWISPRRSSG